MQDTKILSCHRRCGDISKNVEQKKKRKKIAGKNRIHTVKMRKDNDWKHCKKSPVAEKHGT